MIQITQSLLRNSKDLNVYEKQYHAGSFERIPRAKDTTYNELVGTKEAVFITASLLQPYSRNDADMIANHREAMFLKYLSDKINKLAISEEFEVISLCTHLGESSMENGMSANALIITSDEDLLDDEVLDALQEYIEKCVNGEIDGTLRESVSISGTVNANTFMESENLKVEAVEEETIKVEESILENNEESSEVIEKNITIPLMKEDEYVNDKVKENTQPMNNPSMGMKMRMRQRPVQRISLTEMKKNEVKVDKTPAYAYISKVEDKPFLDDTTKIDDIEQVYEPVTEIKEVQNNINEDIIDNEVNNESLKENIIPSEYKNETSVEDNEIDIIPKTEEIIEVEERDLDSNEKGNNFSRFIPENITDELIKKQTEEISKIGDIPYLNTIDTYYPVSNIKELDEEIKPYKFYNELVDCKTIATKQKLNAYFIQTMNNSMTAEHPEMVRAMKGIVEKERWMKELEMYVDSYCKIMPQDKEIFMRRLEEAYYSYYILTSIIANEDVSDIRVTSAENIIAKIKGKHYQATDMDGNPIKFITDADYLRFIEMLTIRNGYNPDNPPPIMVFTDKYYNDDYILRFNVCSGLIDSTDMPYLHIRKVAKEKTDIYKLIEAGMLDEKLASYLLDKVQTSKGLVFAGPSASGKTTLMNALVDFIPKTESILCIQESEELFTYKHPNAYFQRILKDPLGTPIIGLSQLGQNGLLCDSQYFIIGECKGAEVRDLLRASNTGHKCWCSVHSQSSMETIPRLADYVKYGADYSLQEAERMLKDLEVIVYIQNFKIMEISEIAGYDDEAQKMIYRPIYRRNYKSN